MSDLTTSQETEPGAPDWLMVGFLDRVPGTRAVQLASKDGMPMAQHGLSYDQSGRLSALACSLFSQLDSGLRSVTESPDTVHQETFVTAGDTLAVIMEATERTALIVLAEPDADIAAVGYELGRLVDQVREHLGAPPRSDVEPQTGQTGLTG